MKLEVGQIDIYSQFERWYAGCDHSGHHMKFTPKKAYLDAVPRAVTQACSIPLKYKAGFFLVIMKYIRDSVPAACITSPRMTVNIYKPSCSAVLAKSSMLIILPAIKHMIPNGEYLDNQ